MISSVLSPSTTNEDVVHGPGVTDVTEPGTRICRFTQCRQPITYYHAKSAGYQICREANLQDANKALSLSGINEHYKK